MSELFDDFNIEESNELENEIIQIPKEVRKLRTQPYDKSVVDLIEMVKRNDICLQPSFQRKAVWDNKRCSLLIESIWLNIPIPQVFVSVEDDGMWNVIDGQQRITALKRYLNNEFKLTGLEVLPELNGKLYKDLESKPQRILNGGNIRIVAIHEDSHPDIKFDVFMRINQGAMQLNAQELRNCLYRGDFNDLLHQLVKNEYLLNILNLKEPHNRFKDVEMVLRYLALSESYHKNFENYPGVMKTFLNGFMLEHRNDNEHLDKLEKNFNENIEKVFTIFGKYSFRKWDVEAQSFDRNLNLSLMDSQMLSVEKFSLEQIQDNSEEILQAFKEIFINPKVEVIDAITSGTSSKVKLITRINFFDEMLNKIINEDSKE